MRSPVLCTSRYIYYMKSDQKRGIICIMYIIIIYNIIYRSNHSRGCYNINTSCRASILHTHTHTHTHTHIYIYISRKKHTSIQYIHNYYDVWCAPRVLCDFFFLKDPNIDTRFIYAARTTLVYYKHYGDGGVRLPRIGVEKK
jgi:hypothetical protein